MADKKKMKNCAACSKCDEAALIQQRIFEREVDEELQQERLQKLWQKYRFWLIGGIALILCSTVGYEVYQSWWKKVRLNESDAYEVAVVDAHAGKTKEALAGLKRLGESGKTGYQYLARMETVGILLASNKEQEALSVLADLMNDGSAPEALRVSATLAFVGHRLETGNPDELQTLLTPILTVDNGAFAGSVAELSAVLSIRKGQEKQAAFILQQALSNDRLPLSVRERLTYLLSEVQ